MQTYKYKAVSKAGHKVNGIIEAYDEFEAVSKIRETCDVVTEIKEVEKNESKFSWESINEPMKLSEKVLSLTASQFAILLRSGLPASRTVEVIANQSSDKLMKKILTEVAKDVAAGYSLANSLELHGKKIPETFIETIRAGEESGTLEESFDKMAKYYEKSGKLKSKVRSALIYPAALIILSIVVVIIVVKVAVPTIAGMILESGGEIPAPTQLLLNMYNFMENNGLLVLAVIAVIVIAALIYKRTPEGKLKFAQLAFKIPVIGNINHMNAASQFASTMTTLLGSGLHMNRCADITGKVMDNYAAGKTVREAATGLEEGRTLGEMLRGNEYLPELLVEMASVGEESGSVEETLATIGLYYDSEVEQASAKALSMMEPIITVFLGVVIGFIVIALYLPMFSMYSGM